MLSRADDLAALKVLDADGQPVALGSVWGQRPTVLLFIRHFG